MSVSNCPACRRANEPPFFFCEHCGAPRLHLGRTRVLANLTLAMLAFVATWHFAEEIGWDWPLFTLYGLFAWQFVVATVGAGWRAAFRASAWVLIFLLLFAVGRMLVHFNGDAAIFISLAEFVPEAAREWPLVFYPVLAGVLTLALVPCLFGWARRHGWHTAYRVALAALAALATAGWGGARLLGWVESRNLLPSLSLDLRDFVNNALPAYDLALGDAALILTRVLLAEVFVSSALLGYRAAGRARLAGAGRLGEERGFTRSLLMLALAARRFMLLLEQMMREMARALVVTGRALGAAFAAFVRDLLLPTLAFAGLATLVYLLARATRLYVEGHDLIGLARLLAGVAGLLLAQMAAAATLSRYRVARVIRTTLELIGWLLPNLMVFFMLMSLSLWLTGRLIDGWEPQEGGLPFRLGLLTRADAVLLALLVATILWRRRGLFAVTLEGESEGEPESETKAEAKPAKGKKKGKKRASADDDAPRPAGPTLAGRLLGRAQSGVREGMQVVSERLQGKPAAVDRLARARAKAEETRARLRELEKIRDTIAPEAYDKLYNTARGELTCLEADLDCLQPEVDRLYAECLIEKASLEARLAGLELGADAEADAAAPADLKDREAALAEAHRLSERIDRCARQLEFLVAEASPANKTRSAQL